MNRQLRGLLQLAFLIAVVFALLRLFPLILRFSEAAAMGLREFWWAILALILGGWLLWVLRKRNSG